MPTPDRPCTAPHPEGPRPAVAKGLCASHYRWSQRHPGEPLRSLRSGRALVQLPGVRVPHEVVVALRRELVRRGSDDSLGEQVRRVLEAWARR